MENNIGCVIKYYLYNLFEKDVYEIFTENVKWQKGNGKGDFLLLTHDFVVFLLASLSPGL